MSTSVSVKQLSAQWITPDIFRGYGQVIFASVDGKSFDAEDAQLNLHNGIPRFYIMRLQNKGRKFRKLRDTFNVLSVWVLWKGRIG